MNIPDAAVEAAAEAWISRHTQPGSWTLEENLRAALEAALPYLTESARHHPVTDWPDIPRSRR